jgi:4-amino-4-deoxy-L-arabinose transferase-like glycosyltransferase
VKWAGIVIVAALAIMVRLPHLGDATPWYDEYYHLLAAESWLDTGSFAIGKGEYVRAALFTRLVGGSFSLFGVSLAAARVPAVIAGVLWVVLVFAWTRRVAGAPAAWVTGLLFALDPGGIFLSQMVRFYSLQGLLVLVGLLSVYRLAERPFPPGKSASLLVLAAILSFGLALRLQPTTMIAIAVAGIWLGGVLLARLPSWWSNEAPRRKWILLSTIVGSAIGILAWVVMSGRLDPYLQAYTGTFYWMNGELTSSHWYVWWLRNRYPIFWMLFPIATVIALVRANRPALFASTVFLLSFLAVSFASARAERYLYFAMPFFFIVWGIALADLLPRVRKLWVQAVEAFPSRSLAPSFKSRIGLVLLTGTVGFLLFENSAFRMTLEMIVRDPERRPYREANWTPLLPRLRTLADSAEVVVSSYLLKPLYYLDRGDAHLSWTETAEAGFRDGRPIEFSVHPRTGLPAFSTPQSLSRVMSCYNSGLVLTERFHLNRPHLVTAETSTFLSSHLETVPLPAESWVLAFRWRHPIASSRAGCPPPGFPTSSDSRNPSASGPLNSGSP